MADTETLIQIPVINLAYSLQVLSDRNFVGKSKILIKIRSRRAVKRPLQVSPSSRCPSGGRFAPYLGSKRSVAGQVPLFERTGTWVNGVQPVICVLLPGPNWCVPNSSTRCQAFASSSSAILLSEQVPSGCCALWDGMSSFGGGEGWVV